MLKARVKEGILIIKNAAAPLRIAPSWGDERKEKATKDV